MYTFYYGLNLNPFENTPDPSFLFPSESHREVLAALRYGIDNAKGFILLAGDVGTGKTTMISALLKDINPSYVVLNIVNPKWAFDDILRYLALKLEIDADHEENFKILEELQVKLEKLDDQQRPVVLIIDEAHLLSETALEDIRLLSNLERDYKKLIQIVLVGQEEIYQTLQKSSLKTLQQRISINRHLRPLNQKETIQYINHRLKVAGRRSELFSKKALALIWKHSQGVPRLINHICDNAMLIGYAADAQFIRKKVVKEVLHDMNYGYRRFNVQALLRFAKLRWAWATLIIFFSAVTIVNYFTPDALRVGKNVSQETVVAAMRPAESVIKNLDNQKPLAPQAKQARNTQAPPEAESANTAKNKNTAFREPDLKTTQPVSGEGPRELIPSMIQHMKNIKIVSQAKDVALTTKIVKPNDSLSAMAKKTYGIASHTVIDLIHTANPHIKNINHIYTSQIINLPLIEKKDLIYKDESGNYYIHYASFYQVEDAWQCLRQLKNKDQKSFILPTQQQQNKVYRVYYGSYKSLAEARRGVENLNLRYFRFIDR